MREAMRMMKDCESLLFVGSGFGFAEVVLAAENPNRRFIVTEIPGNTSGLERANKWILQGQIMNVELGEFDVMSPGRHRRVDAVLSTEVLEYVKSPRVAANNMLDLSSKATFCLTPFALTGKGVSRTVVKDRMTPGFDKSELRELFGSQAQIRWAYWSDAGLVLRNELAKLSPETIKDDAQRLLAIADRDIRVAPAAGPKAAQAIKSLARH